MAFIPAFKKHEATISQTKPWNLGDSGRAEREFTRRRKCQHSQISRGQRVAEFAGWLSEVWRQIQTPDLFYFHCSPSSHFLWHLLFNTFPPHARRSTATKYLSQVSSEPPACSWGYNAVWFAEPVTSYFSHNPSRVHNTPHSCLQSTAVFPQCQFCQLLYM